MLQFFYLFFCGNVLIRLKKHTETLKKVILFLIILYLMILMCFSYTNNDTGIYKYNIYEGYRNAFWSKDVGFGVLIQIGYFFNWNYETFRFAIYFCAILLIHFGVSKMIKNNEILFWLIYCLYPLFLDNIETRNFLAYAILIFALPFFLETKKSKKVLFYLLFICSCLIHKIMCIYLIPIILSGFIETEKRDVRITFDVIFAILCVLGMGKDLFLNILNSMPQWLQSIPGISRNLKSTNNNGWIVNFVITILFYLSIRMMYTKAVDLMEKGEIDPETNCYKYCKIIYIMGVFGSMFIPLYIISGDYMRVIRNLYAFGAIAILLILETTKIKIRYVNLTSCSLIILVLTELAGIASIFYSNNQTAIIYDIFVNNYIFNFGELRYTWEERPW